MSQGCGECRTLPLPGARDTARPLWKTGPRSVKRRVTLCWEVCVQEHGRPASTQTRLPAGDPSSGGHRGQEGPATQTPGQGGTGHTAWCSREGRATQFRGSATRATARDAWTRPANPRGAVTKGDILVTCPNAWERGLEVAGRGRGRGRGRNGAKGARASLRVMTLSGLHGGDVCTTPRRPSKPSNRALRKGEFHAT